MNKNFVKICVSAGILIKKSEQRRKRGLVSRVLWTGVLWYVSWLTTLSFDKVTYKFPKLFNHHYRVFDFTHANHSCNRQRWESIKLHQLKIKCFKSRWLMCEWGQWSAWGQFKLKQQSRLLQALKRISWIHSLREVHTTVRSYAIVATWKAVIGIQNCFSLNQDSVAIRCDSACLYWLKIITKSLELSVLTKSSHMSSALSPWMSESALWPSFSHSFLITLKVVYTAQA